MVQVSSHIINQYSYINQSPDFEEDAKNLMAGIGTIHRNININRKALYPMIGFLFTLGILLNFGPYLQLDPQTIIVLSVGVIAGVWISITSYIKSKHYLYQAEGILTAADILAQSAIQYIEYMENEEEYEYEYYDEDDEDQPTKRDKWSDHVDEDD
jgi:hypothetical protein